MMLVRGGKRYKGLISRDKIIEIGFADIHSNKKYPTNPVGQACGVLVRAY